MALIQIVPPPAPPPPPPGLSIDNGIVFLIITAVLYGFFQINIRKKTKKIFLKINKF
ncbi:hypothetical protein [Polaribacter sp. Z022]|uniref:hypothetical protein n=1 Tax=Polaribacter sp. Z022 TaxID=2927125 RepID=UPI00201FD450|nr:hypothetical protein [Polaribacter sp. Z022]MCL7753141.1 hypothetical protein [Polaribacter sp. Z022]